MAGIVLALAVYVVLAVAVYLPHSPFDAQSLPQCNCGDNAMAAAFLEWTPWALLHGNNPLLTHYQYFPTGANLATNTTMPVLGVLLAPLTLTAGPILALNVLLRLAFAASAASAFLVLRRYTRSIPSAFAGGLVFGFSPYMLGQGEVHANLLFVPLIPVLFLLIDEIVTGRRSTPAAAGLSLGVVAALQYGISSELLADAAIVGVLGVALLAAMNRKAVGGLRRVITGFGWALAAFVPLTAYPVLLALFGPLHLNGPPRRLALLTPLRADLLGAIVPTTRQILSLGPLGAAGSGYANGNLVENGVYVGLPLLALAIFLVLRFRRDRRLAWSGTMALGAYVLSLGSTLDLAGHVTPIPLPDRLLLHVPLLDAIVTVRFFVFGWWFLALVLAIGLDHLARHGVRPAPAPVRAQMQGPALAQGSAPPAPAGAARRGALCALLTAAALVPLLPRLPFPTRPTDTGPFDSYPVPSYFTSPGADRAIPAGTPVIVYPFSDPALTAGLVDYSALWQAVAGERFKLLDGDATRPGPGGVGTEAAPDIVPRALQTILFDAYFGPHARYGPTPLETGPLPRLTPAIRRQVREALVHYGISTVIADPVGRDPDAFVAAMDAVLGRPPATAGGVLVWYGVQHDVARQADRAAGQSDRARPGPVIGKGRPGH